MSRKADVVRITSEEARRIRSETDEARVEAIRDEEITRRAQEDPDNPPVDEEFLAGDWERTDLRQAKKPVTIRLDSEVIDWFKRGDRCGYQPRINKVLLAYVRHQKVRREKAGRGRETERDPPDPSVREAHLDAAGVVGRAGQHLADGPGSSIPPACLT
ncbi:hypothetical protein Desaf_2550 [Desulfocurvibacter africanus subsp. africanus str. Walvis Bay]|uniref:BrnA antitoxin family protein n=1 Tax=Desulfocurvibacter africanus subsp. africanus str. Walvis Bay TaxID=690850 RepID=F3YZR7_DESAF|nr:BrnA antitoxin family protein [Desulfocurvibacter africanus]EGJ50872.1 hypothetical protein Desaf_2550 [Desulfocurvibacter africanus subsp. africanus str. Walvis Bay]